MAGRRPTPRPGRAATRTAPAATHGARPSRQWEREGPGQRRRLRRGSAAPRSGSSGRWYARRPVLTSGATEEAALPHQRPPRPERHADADGRRRRAGARRRSRPSRPDACAGDPRQRSGTAGRRSRAPPWPGPSVSPRRTAPTRSASNCPANSRAAAIGDRPASTPRARLAMARVCHSWPRSGSSRRAASAPMANRGERAAAGPASPPGRWAASSPSRAAPASAMAMSRRASPRPSTSVWAPMAIEPSSTTVGPTCSAAKSTLKTPMRSPRRTRCQRAPRGLRAEAAQRHQRRPGPRG